MKNPYQKKGYEKKSNLNVKASKCQSVKPKLAGWPRPHGHVVTLTYVSIDTALSAINGVACMIAAVATQNVTRS